ncbi:MAG TPA: D-hexose-6-phosphate mutarotase [Steroidobacteraceae bacterium]|nr:D-hexose-6-phosphate mutarotase [Steroidobacteraceae bacterium]
MSDGRAASYRRLGIPGVAEVVEGNGGLPKVRITTPEAIGEIYLHGAHITSWKPSGAEEAFFVSSQSRWEDGRAVRGGVPICFPWFGGKSDDAKAPAHGFVRTKAWSLESISQVGRAVMVSMFTESNEDTRRWWPAEFRLLYRATFGRELSLELLTTNTGRTRMSFEEALHAYHRVGDIHAVRLKGLDGVRYFDKTVSARKVQDGEVAISSETDRIYLGTTGTIELDDPVMHRATHVMKDNSRTTVVWNPWIDKARALADLGNDEWTRMVCIESSNVSDFAVDLSPGEQHALSVRVRLEGTRVGESTGGS